MFSSLSEFKFFQSFRIKVESSDELRYSIEVEDDVGKFAYVENIQLEDISMTGVGIKTDNRYSVGTRVRTSLNFKRVRIDVEGEVVRAFGQGLEDETMLYGIEVDQDDHDQLKRLIEQYVQSFSPDRARDCILEMALSNRYKSATEGFEIFSLMLSLFKDITSFGSDETFVESMLTEIARILNASRATIFLINPKNNELEAIAALGTDKKHLHFDYRKGIAGSVFTTGITLNIDTTTDKIRFSKEMDEVTGYETKSILCAPISNREDKIIGVIQVLNKRNEQRFTYEDEKTMKVLTLIFSSVFHHYNPMSEQSLIRRFSTPYDREFAYIGRSSSTNEMRRAIVRMKDIDSSLLINGPEGVGKKLLARIIHQEGKRGIKSYGELQCRGLDESLVNEKLFKQDSDGLFFFERYPGGTVVLANIDFLSLKNQAKIFDALSCHRYPGSKIALDIRVICTTSSDLTELVKEGKFHNELFELISEAEFTVEPLGRRSQDVEDLVNYFVRKECRKQGLLLKEFTPELIELMKNFDWPGNVSQLKQVVEKAILYHPKSHVISQLNQGPTPIIDLSLEKMSGFDNIPMATDWKLPLKDRVALVEREMIMAEIRRHKGNKSQAAKSMGISREALRKKLIHSDEVLGKHDNVVTLPVDKKDQRKAA